MNLYQENLKTGWVLNITTNKHSVKRTVTQKNSFISFKVSYEVVKNPPETQEKACVAGDMFSILGSGKIPWRKKWQPTPVFLPGEFHGQRSLVGYSPWGCKESDTTEQTHAREIKYTLTTQSGNSTLVYLTKRNGITCPRKTCECSQRLYASQPRTEKNPNSHQLMSGPF